MGEGAVTGAYPKIWIATPIDNFVVPSYTEIRAATSVSTATVRSISFYADGKLVGTITNSPYSINVSSDPAIPMTQSFTASLVDTAGETNSSAPVRITFDVQKLFGVRPLPAGQTVLFRSVMGGPWCIQWSADLQTWKPPISDQIWGNSVLVDETTTNSIMQRFYKLQDCL
jgi:hypothetical protein